MSQPPDPYNRQFSFSSWSITHPTEPHQGDKIDLEFNEVRDSILQTQSRLAEIQLDSGALNPASLATGIAVWTQEIATQAAERTYADNLASLSNKGLARLNLQMPQFYPEASGSTMWIYSDPLAHPSFPPGVAGPTQTGGGLGILTTSTAFSRQFRASVLFGTQYDYATSTGLSGPPYTPHQPTSNRVDNVSMALLFGGTLGSQAETLGTFPGIAVRTDTFRVVDDGRNLDHNPNANNPFATVKQLLDAVYSQMDAHKFANGTGGTFSSLHLANSNQRAALDASQNPSTGNPYITLSQLNSPNGLPANILSALTGASSPSSSNVFITNSGLAGVVSSKANQTALDDLANTVATKAAAVHTHVSSDIYLSDNPFLTIDDRLLEKADITYVDDELLTKADETSSGVAKAWVTFSGLNPANIIASRNVTSVTRVSTGVYTINFTSGKLANGNYCWIGSGRSAGSNQTIIISQDADNLVQSSSQLRVTAQDDTGAAQDATLVNIVIFA